MTIEIGKRLENERIRLNYTQQKMGEYVGIGRRAYINYEKGKREISAEGLNNIDKIGADVLYITTGKPSALSEEEQMIIMEYRKMNISERAQVLNAICKISTPENQTQQRAEVKQHIEGNASGSYAEGNAYTIHMEKKPI